MSSLAPKAYSYLSPNVDLCCDSIEIEKFGTFSKVLSDDKKHRPKYVNPNVDEWVYSKGRWLMVRNKRIFKKMQTSRYCLSEALSDVGVEVKCLKKQPQVAPMSTSDGTHDGKDFKK